MAWLKCTLKVIEKEESQTLSIANSNFGSRISMEYSVLRGKGYDETLSKLNNLYIIKTLLKMLQ
jgi:hypothetical protein